ncbi:MAG: very short patch repair endonuclease [Solirubrobacterales bacterium]
MSKPVSPAAPNGKEPWKDVPELRRRIMRANRQRDTSPELALRRELHRLGLRYRIDFPIRPTGQRLTRPDVVFPSRRIALYVDGCFWHGCPDHGTQASTNRDYWAEKIAANRARDARLTQALEEDGWTVIRFWEHDDPTESAYKIKEVVAK